MNRLNKEGHIVEEINGVRCSIVEKNVSPERTEFLKSLLSHNGFSVIVAQTPPPPPKPAPKPTLGPDGQPLPTPPLPLPPPTPDTYTIGVTDISFHPMLAVYERSLRTPEGKIVTIAYWNQEAAVENELYWNRRVKLS